MLWGLERLSGVLTSLLLSLESPFTVLVAVLIVGRIKITLAESRSLILSQMRAPKFSCFLMSDRLLAPYKDF
jgi:hypothetical protein